MKDQSAYVEVKAANGTYLTNAVNKQRASCTAGAEQAVRRLAEKLWGAGSYTVKQLPSSGSDSNVTQWHVRAGGGK